MPKQVYIFSFHHLYKLIAFYLAISQDLLHQPRTNDFSTMNGDNRSPAVWMTYKMVTSLLTANPAFCSLAMTCKPVSRGNFGIKLPQQFVVRQ